MITDDDDKVSIPQEEWDELQGRLSWLAALEAAGVDNWDGYDFALEIFEAFDG